MKAMNLKFLTVFGPIFSMILASCSTDNMNSAAVGQIQPLEGKVPTPSETEDQEGLGLNSKKRTTCEKTCRDKKYTLGGCWDLGKKTEKTLHCKGKKIEQWLGDCDNKLSIGRLGLQYWKID
jgi:hypothetical protein